MRYNFLLLGLLVFACEDPPDKGGGGSPPSAEPPRGWIEVGDGLPSGVSSLESLTVKVTGNATATHYQYALFDKDSVTCAAAEYGQSKTIATLLTEISLGKDGKKIICIRGKDKGGNVQVDPKRYTWEKVAKVAVVVADAPEPEAGIEILPTACETNIDSPVWGNAITKQYQYALIDGKDSNCDDNSVSYADAQALTNKLVLSDLGDDGHKTLCLRGLNEDGTRQQKKATKYTWEKTNATLHAGGEKPDAGQGGLGLFCASFVFTSGKRGAHGVTVKNIGSGDLSWKASIAQAAPWFAVKVGSSADNYMQINSPGEIAESNELKAGESESVFFKLNEPEKTDYGEPYQRSLDITFINIGSNYQTTATITLEIPQLDTTTSEVELSSNNPTHRVYAQNLNKSSTNKMEIEIVPAFVTTLSKEDKESLLAKFSGMVEATTGVEITGNNAGDPYIDLKLKDVSCGDHEQTLLVYSNGDSKGATDCSINASKSYIGLSSKARWDTTSCKRIKIAFTMPNNWQAVDSNADGKINIQDLVMVSNQIEKTDPTTADYKKADIDGSGEVDITDLVLVSSCLGYPEP